MGYYLTNEEEFNIKYEYLIGKYFAYFNGRINTFNRAVLNIEWIRGTGCVAGKTYAPNVVIIRPLVIMDASSSMEELLFKTVETIVHELHHTDQFIFWDSPDPNYMQQMIEEPVEAMTAMYIINNARQIENDIKTPLHAIDIQAYFDSKVKYSAISRYTRIDNFRAYIVKTFSNFVNSEFYKFVDLMFSGTPVTVLIKINNNRLFMAMDCGNYCSLDQFNKFMYDNLYKYYHFTVYVNYAIVNTTCTINIQGKLYNELGTIVKE